MEEYEYISLRFIDATLFDNYQSFMDGRYQIDINELIQFLSRQKTGRATGTYHYSISDVIQGYITDSMNGEMERELRWRIASSPIFKVAMERFVHDSLTKWLVANEIEYNNYYSPNSSDYAIVIGNDMIDQVSIALKLDIDTGGGGYDGVILHVDSKSLMGLKNYGDAIAHKEELGKLEAKWNQVSYVPPMLRQAREDYPDPMMEQKHGILPQAVYLDGRKYLSVTCFVSGLFFLEDDLFFIDPLEDLTGEYFNSAFYIINIPNGKLQCQEYDSFFAAGKGGYDSKVSAYPVDCRFKIKNSNGQYLRYHTLTDVENDARYSFIPRPPRTFTLLELGDQGIVRKSFHIR
ncbi:MAG: hypothetical protein ACTSSE_17945 [Candidatus Thorarchaeota archaeon]